MFKDSRLSEAFTEKYKDDRTFHILCVSFCEQVACKDHKPFMLAIFIGLDCALVRPSAVASTDSALAVFRLRQRTVYRCVTCTRTHWSDWSCETHGGITHSCGRAIVIQMSFVKWCLIGLYRAYRFNRFTVIAFRWRQEGCGNLRFWCLWNGFICLGNSNLVRIFTKRKF